MIRIGAIGLALCAVACSGRAPNAATGKRLIVLGIDGLDPKLASQYMDQGRMPHLAELARRGSYARLATSAPPESPVAWADFITSQHSEGHGIYDFIHRDLQTMEPYLSTSRSQPASHQLRLGRWSFPLSSASVELLRDGRPFWDYLDERGIPVSVLLIPASYPPGRHGHARVLAGMGTPDLLGTYGVFQLYTNDPKWSAKEIAGGRVHSIVVRRGDPTLAALDGPSNPLLAEATAMTVRIELTVDEHQSIALVRIGGEERLLAPGEWSDWVPVSFNPGLLGQSVPGMVRLHLESIEPYVVLYVSPVNLDPGAPAQPFATPGFAEQLAGAVGRFHTLGIPEDTKALESGVFTDEEFLAQAGAVLDERVRLLDQALDESQSGLLFVYLGSIDQLSHAFWRTLEPDAPPELRRLAHVLPDYYARIDEIIGRAAARGSDLLVMSDHGFASYRTKVNLNTWLHENGYLAIKEGKQIDWSQTRAYALGLNLLYLNVRGREPFGVVSPDEQPRLVQRLKEALEGLRDPSSGERVVARARVPAPGTHPERAPDLIVGYAPGYRSSERSALGQISDTVFEANHDKWSGDHCMDPEAVPGVIAGSWPLDTTHAPSLVDLGPTILEYFQVPPPKSFVGESLLKKGSAP